MPVIEGAERLKTWIGEYDFDVDTGAVDTYTLRSNDGPIPVGSVIVAGHLEITDGCVSAGGGKMQINVESAEDVFAAALAAALGAGFKDIIPDGTGSTAILLTAARYPELEITIAVFTAGALTVRLFYE